MIEAGWIEQSRLWLVLDQKAASPRPLPDVTSLAIAGGVDAVLCRLKEMDRSTASRIASEVRAICAESGTPFIMSHDIDLAVELMADGIQLGIGDPPIEAVRERVGASMAIGFSTHSVEEAMERFSSGADYVFLGPIYPTPEKLKYGSPLGTKTVTEAIGRTTKPIVFIGGIDVDQAGEVYELGGRRIAVISAIQRNINPELATSALRKAISRAGD